MSSFYVKSSLCNYFEYNWLIRDRIITCPISLSFTKWHCCLITSLKFAQSHLIFQTLSDKKNYRSRNIIWLLLANINGSCAFLTDFNWLTGYSQCLFAITEHMCTYSSMYCVISFPLVCCRHQCMLSFLEDQINTHLSQVKFGDNRLPI